MSSVFIELIRWVHYTTREARSPGGIPGYKTREEERPWNIERSSAGTWNIEHSSESTSPRTHITAGRCKQLRQVY